jgi:hypothetical protein
MKRKRTQRSNFQAGTSPIAETAAEYVITTAPTASVGEVM